MKKLTLDDFQIRLNQVHPNENLQAISYEGNSKDAVVKCCSCGEVYTKKAGCFLDKRKVSICKNCIPTHTNTLKETFDLPEGYSYVESYKGMHNKILIRHNSCGFIWKITPSNLKLGKGCPKCNKKVSKGEQRIIKWLEENNISFVTQKEFQVEGHILFIDFYLPDYDLYIEYDGEQHFKPVEHFGGEEKLKYQISNDNLKRKYLTGKLLEIPYTHFDFIEVILKRSTTIPNGSTLQAMAMEVEKLLNEGV